MSTSIFETQLRQLVEKVSISKENRRANVASTENIIRNLIREMRNVDPLFDEIYCQPTYTESYYERLKTNAADEYDFNLQLKLPFNQQQCQVQHRHFPPGFAKFTLMKPLNKWDPDTSTKYEKLFSDNKKYLSRTKINSWMQSVTDQALQRTNFYNGQITLKSHGAPATTLILSMSNGEKVSVDLVPVIQLEHIPRSVKQKRIIVKHSENVRIPKKDRKSCLVPKPPPEIQPEDDELFRISMPEIEKAKLGMSGHFKPIVRIFKEIRDMSGLEKAFPSYFIKTFFMRMLLNHPKEKYWNDTKITKIFNQMSKVFVQALDSKIILHYFFPKFNLLEGYASEQVLKNMSQKFEEIRRKQRIE